MPNTCKKSLLFIIEEVTSILFSFIQLAYALFQKQTQCLLLKNVCRIIMRRLQILYYQKLSVCSTSKQYNTSQTHQINKILTLQYYNCLPILFLLISTHPSSFPQKIDPSLLLSTLLTQNVVLFYLIRSYLIIVNFLSFLMTATPSSCLPSITANPLSDCADLQDSQNTCDDYLDKDLWNSIFLQYSFVELICETNTSLVWLGCQKVSLRWVALKITQKIQKGGSVFIHQQRQKAFVTQNEFKNMVKVLQIKENKSYRLLVMEYYRWSLADLLSQFTKISNRRYTQQHLNFIIFAYTGILNAVVELHKLGFVHRDLKLDNFMLDQNLNICLNDFELVTKELVVDPSLSGTIQYMAPQRLSKKRITAPITRGVDVWSLGIILYQLFTGQTPYNGQNSEQILQEIYQNYLNVKQIPVQTMTLIRQILQIRPEKRLQLQQIRNSSIFQTEVDVNLIKGLISQ